MWRGGDAGAGVQDEGRRWEETRGCEDGGEGAGLLNNRRLPFLFTQHWPGAVCLECFSAGGYASLTSEQVILMSCQSQPHAASHAMAIVHREPSQ